MARNPFFFSLMAELAVTVTSVIYLCGCTLGKRKCRILVL